LKQILIYLASFDVLHLNCQLPQEVRNFVIQVSGVNYLAIFVQSDYTCTSPASQFVIANNVFFSAASSSFHMKLVNEPRSLAYFKRIKDRFATTILHYGMHMWISCSLFNIFAFFTLYAIQLTNSGTSCFVKGG